MTQGQIEALSVTLEQAASRLEIEIMKDIVRRIKANSDMTASAEYQINRLRQLGLSDKYIKERIQIYLKVSDSEMDRIYNQVIENEYDKYARLYEEADIKKKPFGEHIAIQSVIASAMQETSNTFQNLTQTMGFSVAQNGKKVFLPIAQYYQKALDNAMLGMATGAFGYNTVLKKVVQEMTRSGLRTVNYASGRTMRIESATRMALMTGFNQITRRMNDYVAHELGTEDYEVSYHIGARPTHQVWQGRVYSAEELISVCGLGTVTGLCGINCYHWYDPFIRGVSVRNYTDEELDRMIAEENRPRYYNGKEYTTYTALQRQRDLERTMRKQRQDIALLKEGAGDEFDILVAQTKYHGTMQEYVRFSDAMKLPQQRERIYMDGLGRVSKKVVTEQKNSVIINPTHTKEEGSMAFIKSLGKIDTSVLEKEFGKIQTRDIIVTGERLEHIKERHPEDYNLFEKYGKLSVENPDFVIKDKKHAGTVFMVKKLEGTNLNVVVRVVLETDDIKLKNSVMTFYRIRERNLKKLIEKNALLYKRE